MLMQSLLDQFAVDAASSGRIIALVTVSDLDLTNREANNLLPEDREYIRDCFMEFLDDQFDEAIRFAVAAWRSDDDDVSDDDN